MQWFKDDMGQQALGFLISQTSYIEPQVYRTKYPELNYADFVPVDHSASEWAKSITFFSIDSVGRADWININANDIPLADFSRDKHESAIEMAGIGYRYNIEELGQAMMVFPAVNITTERANAARRAAEEKIHNIAMYGDASKSWAGLTNSPAPAVINVPNTWAFNVVQAPPLLNQIMNDINDAITNVWLSTLTVEMADTVLMPLAAMKLLAITQMPNTTMNLLQWIMANNIYTHQTRQALTIVGVRGLDTAGNGGTGRIIAYRKDPEAIKLHVPMPHRFFTARQVGAFVFEVPSLFRLGGLEWRLPATARYIDGI
jgi:hypothetical protein